MTCRRWGTLVPAGFRKMPLRTRGSLIFEAAYRHIVVACRPTLGVHLENFLHHATRRMYLAASSSIQKKKKKKNSLRTWETRQTLSNLGPEDIHGFLAKKSSKTKTKKNFSCHFKNKEWKRSWHGQVRCTSYPNHAGLPRPERFNVPPELDVEITVLTHSRTVYGYHLTPLRYGTGSLFDKLLLNTHAAARFAWSSWGELRICSERCTRQREKAVRVNCLDHGYDIVISFPSLFRGKTRSSSRIVSIHPGKSIWNKTVYGSYCSSCATYVWWDADI